MAARKWKNLVLMGGFVVAMTVGVGAQAQPLPAGTPLRISAGVGSSLNVPCSTGSCVGFEMDLAPGSVLWFDLTPGTDGGIVVGKNQQPGEIAAGFPFFGTSYIVTAPQPGSLCTNDASANRFDDMGLYGSCSGTGCLGLTEFNTLHLASAGDNSCNPLGGGSVKEYGFDAVRGRWRLAYDVVCPSCFGGAKFHMILSGPTHIIADPIPVAQDVALAVVQDTSVVWKPPVSIFGDVGVTCEISSPPLQGTATVTGDCSQGTYTPAAGYSGNDSFIYQAFGGIGSDTGIVSVSVTGTPGAKPVTVSGQSGTMIPWKPLVISRYAMPACAIEATPGNGTVTVAADCSTGSYRSNPGFIGTDRFVYNAVDCPPPPIMAPCFLYSASVTVAVTEPEPDTTCATQYPVSQFSQTGKAGTLSINFTGNIVSHTNKAVEVCPGTPLNYRATSTQGPVVCQVKNNATRGSGSLKVNDNLKCTDKPAGKDKVGFKVKSGVR